MSRHVKIAIADNSTIIRAGLEGLVKKISDFKVQVIELVSPQSLVQFLQINKPDVLIVNPLFAGPVKWEQVKEESGCPDLKCFALLYTLLDPLVLKTYDEQILIYDSPEEIRRKLEQAIRIELEDVLSEEDSQVLSSREKEIVVCVVKGMTNREIADTLYLSTHTVITHRRNIARKLQIHSASGLTVYAIVNKLIALEDIQIKG